jgi:hypothetical protein
MNDLDTLRAEKQRITDAIAAQQAEMGRMQASRPAPSKGSVALATLARQLATVTMKIRTQEMRAAKPSAEAAPSK